MATFDTDSSRREVIDSSAAAIRLHLGAAVEVTQFAWLTLYCVDWTDTDFSREKIKPTFTARAHQQSVPDMAFAKDT